MLGGYGDLLKPKKLRSNTLVLNRLNLLYLTAQILANMSNNHLLGRVGNHRHGQTPAQCRNIPDPRRHPHSR